MKSSGPLKHFILAFVIAVVLYAIAYNFIENRRTRRGPWEITFANAAGTPELVINQPKLPVTHCIITFLDEKTAVTNLTLAFAQPKPVPFDVPFGQCVFEDTTFQPGTVVLNLFGHEIQLMPRTLTIDRKEFAWQSGGKFAVSKSGISRAAP